MNGAKFKHVIPAKAHVIPAKAGIQAAATQRGQMDSRLRGNDEARAVAEMTKHTPSRLTSAVPPQQ